MLLSIFPLLILLLALTGLIADQHTVRENAMKLVRTYIPLSGRMQNGSTGLGVLGGKLLGLHGCPDRRRPPAWMAP